MWKGAVDDAEAADGRAAAAALGLSAPEVVPVRRGSARRTLWVFRKVAVPPGVTRGVRAWPLKRPMVRPNPPSGSVGAR